MRVGILVAAILPFLCTFGSYPHSGKTSQARYQTKEERYPVEDNDLKTPTKCSFDVHLLRIITTVLRARSQSARYNLGISNESWTPERQRPDDERHEGESDGNPYKSATKKDANVKKAPRQLLRMYFIK